MTLDRTENINELTRLYKEKKFPLLVKTAKEIVEKDNSSATLWNFLALGYRYTGETKKSIDIYDNLLKRNPTNFILNTNAGNLFFDIGKLHDAIKYFEAALLTHPEHTPTLFSFGLALTSLGQPNEAKACFEKIIKLEPNNHAAHFRIGRILQLTKKYAQAIEHFEKTDFDLSKTHELECYYLLGDKELYFKKFFNLIKNNPINPLMSTIACHAAIRFDQNEENPFCNKPMNYVFKTGVTKHDGLDSKLISDIIRIKDTIDLKNQPLLWNGAQSSGNLFLSEEPAIKKLKEILEIKILEYRKNFSGSNEGFIKNWPKDFALYGWLVSIKSGGKLDAHIHREGWLSGSIYLKMPKKRNPQEGNILFGLRGSDYPDEGKDYPQQEYDVTEKSLVLFPSSLYHQTLPFSSDENRISFAFDVIPSRE